MCNCDTQASSSADEWSDGTGLDYTPKISQVEPGSTSGQQDSSCVFVTPTGSWERGSCHDVMEGALCYTTPAGTQSETGEGDTHPESTQFHR